MIQYFSLLPLFGILCAQSINLSPQFMYQYESDSKQFGSGNLSIRDYELTLFGKYKLLPHDIAYFIKSGGNPLHLYLYKENFIWAKEYTTKILPYENLKYDKSFMIITSQYDYIMHTHYFHIKDMHP